MNREDLRTVLKLMNEGYKEMNVEFEDKTDYVLDTSGTNCPLPIAKSNVVDYYYNIQTNQNYVNSTSRINLRDNLRRGMRRIWYRIRSNG